MIKLKLNKIICGLVITLGAMSLLMQHKAMASDATIDLLKEKYPHGAYWNHVVQEDHSYVEDQDQGECNNPDGYTWTPCDSHNGNVAVGGYGCNSFENSMQSLGFVKKLAYDIYGSTHTSWKRASIENAKPGDILRYYGSGVDTTDGHWAMIIEKSGNTFTFAECNVDANCRISWGRTLRTTSMSGYELYAAPYALSAGSSISYGTVKTEFVEETNVGLYAEINNPKKYTFTSMGVKIWDSEGTLIVDYNKPCTLATDIIYQRLDVVKDVKPEGLNPGETYTYQMWAMAGEVTYKTQVKSFTTLSVKKDPAIYGDVNLNGEVSAEDALDVLKHVVKLKALTGMNSLGLADVNHDRAIDAEDALNILKVTVRLREKEYTYEYTLEK